MRHCILLVDDDEGIQFGFSKYLSLKDYSIHKSTCLAQAKEMINTQKYDVVILDNQLPDGNGVDWIIELRENYPDTAIIVITAFGNIPMAVDAMRRGADHFLTKPVSMPDLDLIIQKSLELYNLKRKAAFSQRRFKKEAFFWGKNSLHRTVKEMALKAANTDSSILITGRTGTGKRLLANWIHQHSLRRSQNFVDVNCASLKDDLLSSELFGHTKGAFTSAVSDKKGLLEFGQDGTLFLDEINEMDIKVQSQILKVLEEKVYRRMGDTKIRHCDIRWICASNRDLQKEIHDRRFREDLYYRINVFPIHLPPLREMKEDIPDLVYHILHCLGASKQELSPVIINILQSYNWPGNIRELKNLLERALILANGNPLEPIHFPGLGHQMPNEENTKANDNLVTQEASHIRAVLEQYNQDKEQTCHALGISLSTLYRKLKTHGIKL